MRRRVKRTAAIAAGVLMLLTGCSSNLVESGSFVFASPGGKTEFSYPASERRTIGDFTGTSVTDAETTIKLSDYPDRILVLNFWAAWCGPCRGETPDLKVVSELHHNNPVQFMGINLDKDRQAGADFIASSEVGYPSIYDPTSRTMLSIQGFPSIGIPHTIVLDRQHRVAHIFLGQVTAQKLDETITSLVTEAS